MPVSSGRRIIRRQGTHVAPASISSIILAFVNRDRMDRYTRVAATMTMIRAGIEEVRMQMTTGVRRSSAIKSNIKASAILLIRDPEYR